MPPVLHSKKQNSMKKIYILLSLSALLLFPSIKSIYAAPVDTTVAKQAAIAFCQRQRNSSDPQLVYTHILGEQGNETPAFYVFDLNNGFVIISANDVADPVLGYSDESRFNPEQIPDNMRSFLNGYAREIKVLEEHNAPSKWQNAFVSQPKDTLTGVIVGPLLTTKWSQDTLYNDMCPADTAGPNGHAVTGCVATAMAQVIRYWEHPTVGQGEYGYDDNYEGAMDGMGNYGYLYANFGNTTYDYAHMPDLLDETSSAEEIEAVATLIYHCGVSVNMMYGTQGSAAIGFMVAKALRNYFRYSSDVKTILRNDYTYHQWHELVNHELDEHAPVLYSGSGAAGGHAFVCDGYSDDNYYHINWGWEGRYDGYFKLELLNPADYSFASGQDITINVRPVPVNVPDNQKTSLQVYPNPAEDQIKIQHSSMMNKVQIFDVFGKLLQSTDLDDTSASLNVSGLASGTYILRIFDDQNVSVRKFIKR